MRSLRWSEQGKEVQDALLPKVESFLSNPEWQVSR